MYFSGKITHSIISHLTKEGVDFASLYDLTDLPTEFLKDPSCWLDAQKVEAFLKAVDQKFSDKFIQRTFKSYMSHGYETTFCTNLFQLPSLKNPYHHQYA